MVDAYRCIARIQKTHGRKGEVVVVSTDGLPFLLEEGMKVCLVPPALKGPRWFVVQSCSGDGPGQLVTFANIDTLGLASKIVGKHVLVQTSDLPKDYVLHDANALLGREVTDEELGSLGTICEVMRTPAHDVWVVRGAYGEVLIPAVEPIVVSWQEGEPMCVRVPAGLVDIQASVEEGERQA